MYKELTEGVIIVIVSVIVIVIVIVIVVVIDDLCWQDKNTHGRENCVLGMWSTSSLDTHVRILCPALGSQR